MRNTDVIIIGGGAAGLMCGLTAGQRGRKVLLLERANKVGKKILMSGGGRCNFTNLHIQPENYLSHNPHFCKSALSRYTQWDFIAMVEAHGIAYHEKTLGQLFCDHSSKDILNMLLDECRQAGVDILTECDTSELGFDGRNYILETSKGRITAPVLVVASGGLSIPKMGGSGFGYELARQFDLDVFPTRAALVPLTMTDQLKGLCERLAGLSTAVKVSCGRQSFSENLLFTHRGLSGPALLQISSYWQPGNTINIDFFPATDARQLLITAKLTQSRSLLRNVLKPYLPKKLIDELESLFWKHNAKQSIGNWPDRNLFNVADQLQQWTVKPSGTEGYRTAEVTIGGVDTRHISSQTMECTTQPGLYFIGEVLDVTGHLGGFNFQWAWSSGFTAGQAV